MKRATKGANRQRAEDFDGVIDRRAFNHEVAQERADAAHIAAMRKLVLTTLQEEIAFHGQERKH